MLPSKLYRITQIDINRIDFYPSIPLTSGGVVRLKAYYTPANITKWIHSYVVPHNAKIAREILQKIEEENPRIKVSKLNPSNMNSTIGWSQIDYIKFWFFYISGISVEHAQQYEVEFDSIYSKESMQDDFEKSKEEREKKYKLFLDYFLDFLKVNKVTINPVSGIIALPDYHLSLGCKTEIRLAQELGLPIFTTAFNTNYQDKDNSVLSNQEWRLIFQCDPTFSLDFYEGKASKFLTLVRLQEKIKI